LAAGRVAPLEANPRKPNDHRVRQGNLHRPRRASPPLRTTTRSHSNLLTSQIGEVIVDFGAPPETVSVFKS